MHKLNLKNIKGLGWKNLDRESNPGPPFGACCSYHLSYPDRLPIRSELSRQTIFVIIIIQRLIIYFYVLYIYYKNL